MNWFVKIISLLILFSILVEVKLFAQQIDPDSLKNYSIAKNVDLDTTIFYKAQEKQIDAKTKITRLIGQAEVIYQSTRLNAGLITIDWDKNILIAETLRDSAGKESVGIINNSGGGADSLYSGYPTFTEGGQTMVGEKMFFNFKTKKGRVIRGRTQYQEGFYGGDQIKMFSNDVFYIKDGIFSTCDLDTPHFHFASEKMKMIYKDKVIAKPVVLYIHGIPLAVLPFAVFPNSQGRHSGILVPRYGQSSVEGRYLRGLGYYWAASEYWDTKIQVDFFEKTGFMFHNRTNYSLRYFLRGSISGSLLKKNFEGSKQSRWDVAFNHSQTISPTMSISASGSFVSDGNYYNEFSGNRQQRLRRDIRSNATLTKSWPESRNSMTVNVSRSQFLDTESWRGTLPQINFRHGQEPVVNLFRSRKKSAGTSASDRKWYENIYFSYNSSLLNSISKNRPDKTSKFVETTFLGVKHHISMSSPVKLFRYFTLNQSISYDEIWQDKSKTYFLNEQTNSIESENNPGFAVRRTFRTSLSASTKIYGILPVNRGSIVGFRHVITPNISMSYQPDFSDPSFGYYEEVEDTTGKIFKKDRFSGSSFGSTPRVAQRSINFSVNNLFQMKRIVQEKEQKIDLFTYNLSSRYNFELDSLRFSRLNSSLRANPSRIINVTLSLGHSFYKYDKIAQREINKFVASDNLWSPLRLTHITLSSTLRLSDALFSSGEKNEEEAESASDTTAGEYSDELDQNYSTGNRFETDDNWKTEKIPWTANFSFSYSESHSNPENIIKNMWMNVNGNLRLTQNWRVQYNARINLKDKKVISQDFRINRDLHCWEASFTWTPTGPYKRFFLKINIKSSVLQDIKFEKRGGRGSIFGY